MAEKSGSQFKPTPEDTYTTISTLHEVWGKKHAKALTGVGASGDEIMKEFIKFAGDLDIPREQVEEYFKEKMRRTKKAFDEKHSEGE